MNEVTGNIVQYPRLGGFEVYADGYLVFSKIESNLWPNHGRVVGIMKEMEEERRRGGSLKAWSLENRMKGER